MGGNRLAPHLLFVLGDTRFSIPLAAEEFFLAAPLSAGLLPPALPTAPCCLSAPKGRRVWDWGGGDEDAV